MSHSVPVVVQRPACPIIGLSIVTTLRASYELGIVKQMEATLRERSEEIETRVGTAVVLVQLYPMDQPFNDEVPYTVMVGALVESLDSIPSGMIGYTLPAGDYALISHRGLESQLGDTYQFMYGQGLAEIGRQSAGYDFELWDEQYQPEREDNVIDIYVALMPLSIPSELIAA